MEITGNGEGRAEVAVASELMDRLGQIDVETMTELLASLAWFDRSAHHSRNVNRILEETYPGIDFRASLNEFVRCQKMPHGAGWPR